MSRRVVTWERGHLEEVRRWEEADYPHLTRLARLYGYEGPLLGDFTDEQAGRLADALEAALPDIPNHNALAGKRRLREWAGVVGPVNPPTLLEQFSGGGKDWLREAIAMCRRGAFFAAREQW